MRTGLWERFTDLRAHARGNVAIEFAFIAPVFLAMMFGIVEAGRFYMIQSSLSRAVRDATRYAALHGSTASTPATAASTQSVLTGAATALQTGSITSSVTFSPDNKAGSTVTVSASYPWQPIAKIVAMPAITISARSVLTIQN